MVQQADTSSIRSTAAMKASGEPSLWLFSRDLDEDLDQQADGAAADGGLEGP